jgi:hypothetical protein
MAQDNSDTQITAIGSFNRVMVLRLKPNTDMLLGLEKACKEHNISNGVIVSGIGGVTRAAFCDPQYFADRKQPYNYGDPIVVETHLSISGMSGFICHDDDGTINMHVHVSFSDEEGHCYAGHLVEGTRVMLTVDVVIAELKGLSMTRKMDQELGVMVLYPVQE